MSQSLETFIHFYHALPAHAEDVRQATDTRLQQTRCTFVQLAITIYHSSSMVFQAYFEPLT
eukprot:361741-Amphidinium_carterae.2